MYRLLCEHKFSLPWDRRQGVQRLFCTAAEWGAIAVLCGNWISNFFFLMLLNLFQSLLKTGFNIVTTKRTHTHEDKAVRCFCRKSPTYYLEWLYQFAFTLAMYEWPSFSASSPAFDVITVFILAVLIGVQWLLTAVLICISLMARAVEHLFMYLICYLDILFSEVSLHVFCWLLN